MDWLLNIKAYLIQYPFAFHLLLILITAIIVHILILISYRFLFARAVVKQRLWSKNLLIALRKPLLVFVWYLAVIYSFDLLIDFTKNNSLVPLLDKFTSVCVIIICVWFLLRLVKNMQNQLMQTKHKLDKTTIDGIAKLCKISLFTIAILSVLQALGVPLAAIYTAAGGAGIGITLAAQDLLKNIFGGLMLYFDRPFNIGDWISSPDKQIEGTVEKIGWRSTRLRTFDKRPLYVSNSTFLVVSIENVSRMQHRCICTDIGVRYNDFQQIPKITQAIEEMLQNHSDIAKEQPIWVNFFNFAPSALEFKVYAFTETTEKILFQKIQQAIFIKILEIIQQHGAEVAFPSRTLYLPDDIKINPLNSEKQI